MSNEHIDEVSGTKTTGHDWDGIKELDTPMPRWWLITFYITIIWAIGYCIFYPAIPLLSSNTKGTLGYSSRAELDKSLVEARAEQDSVRQKIKSSSLEQISADPHLLAFAQAGGKAAFKVNCIQCHGSGAEGSKGIANLNDDDWLWGGKLEDIELTIKHGIRFDQDEDTRTSEMPAFGRDKILDDAQIEAVTNYVLSLSSGKETTTGTGAELFSANCAACHGANGAGDIALGAPSLRDQIWLYGGDKADVVESIHNARKAVMPAWAHRLDPETIKQLTIYVHSLGGGQ